MACVRTDVLTMWMGDTPAHVDLALNWPMMAINAQVWNVSSFSVIRILSIVKMDIVNINCNQLNN